MVAADVVPPPCGPRLPHYDYGLVPAGPMTSASWPMSDPGGPASVNLVEIRVVLDGTDPPTGRLQVTSGAGAARGAEPDIAFTGWLGLLRALYLVTGSGPENR
jgi:hypothetical protein